MGIADINIDVGSVITGIGQLGQEIKSLITGEPTPEKMAQVQTKLTELTQKTLEADNAVRQMQTNIIIAEATGQSWLQKNWRPLLMLVIVTIVANNYIIVPYIQLFGVQAVMLDLPDKLWNLMTLGVGGYIAGRSGEKIVTTWKGK